MCLRRRSNSASVLFIRLSLPPVVNLAFFPDQISALRINDIVITSLVIALTGRRSLLLSGNTTVVVNYQLLMHMPPGISLTEVVVNYQLLMPPSISLTEVQNALDTAGATFTSALATQLTQLGLCKAPLASSTVSPAVTPAP